MTKVLDGQVDLLDLVGWSGKTCPEPSQATEAKTSESSSKKSQKSANQMPLYLDLRKANGANLDASWEMGGALLGVFTMDSFGERPSTLMEECSFQALPNGVSASRLSQILQEQSHPKYYLSAKACLGILNRAEKRGKELQEILMKALIRQAADEVHSNREPSE